jgi:hypothetical protein
MAELKFQLRHLLFQIVPAFFFSTFALSAFKFPAAAIE